MDATTRNGIGWLVLRLTLAGLVAAHGYYRPVTIVLSAIYVVGIIMVHAPNGWFVVGAGRNGVEFSVLLIVALLCVGAQHAPAAKEKTP